MDSILQWFVNQLKEDGMAEDIKLSDAIVGRLREMMARHEQEKKNIMQITIDALGLKGPWTFNLDAGILIPGPTEPDKTKKG